MKLSRVQITEFQSVRDSGEFEIGDITCLVGKNEAGKTALLKALYRLNPIVKGKGDFVVADDYPRSDVEDYRQAVESGKREPARVSRAVFVLEPEDLTEVNAALGDGAITENTLTLSRGYNNTTYFTLHTDMPSVLRHLASSHKLLADAAKRVTESKTAEEALASLKDEEATTEVASIRGVLEALVKEGLDKYIYTRFLEKREPKFLYFDSYFQMTGQENIEQLQDRANKNTLKDSDHPLLGLIELARLDLDELKNPARTQELKNALQGAGNYLSKRVLKYWSQNKHLRMTWDVRPARPGDPPGMQSGTNIWAEIYDAVHEVTTGIGTRSAGFVWFFSFLAWYAKTQGNGEPLILLLDEPGLSLHAKAQEDLLLYFEEEVRPNNQLIYTTHSPFMVDPKQFKRVRIVQDRSIDATEPLPPDQAGTKVLKDVLDASGDSLFPLQGALGYEIHQTLFVGPNCVVVEGVSDLLYFQTVSTLLGRAGKTSLSPEWTITPVGGAEKVPTFVALLGSQKGLTIATLIDVQAKDRQRIDELFTRKLLKKNHVLTFADFTGGSEADVEDMFDPAFYVKLVNAEYAKELSSPLDLAKLPKHPRIVVRIEKHLEANPLKKGTFNHYRPARYLSENLDSLKAGVDAAILDRFDKAFAALNALL